MNYPERQSLFALHYVKWLIDSGTTAEAGPDAFALLVAIVMREDEVRYSREVNFYNEQLCRHSGIGSVPALVRARKRAVELGLLHYETGAKRRPGRYFVCGFPNDSLRKAEGKRKESEKKAPPSTPDPIPIPNPISSSKLRFAEEDLLLADWISKKVLEVAPKTKEPSLDKWANEVRLMREKDGHSIQDIRQVFAWANSDGFWRTNILSVSKLREKFPTLHSKMTQGPIIKQANCSPGVNFDPSRRTTNVQF